jgi:hypothetical protein
MNGFTMTEGVPHPWTPLASELRQQAAAAATESLSCVDYGTSTEQLELLRRAWLYRSAVAATSARGLPSSALASSRLWRLLRPDTLTQWPPLDHASLLAPGLPPDALGWWLEGLDDALLTFQAAGSHRGGWRSGAARRRAGAYYTPPALVAQVVQSAWTALQSTRSAVVMSKPPTPWRVCDPSCGAGAFLLEAGRRLVGQYPGLSASSVLARSLHGYDTDELALATAELSIWWLCADAATRPSDLGVGLRCLDATDSAPTTASVAPPTQEPPCSGDFALVLGNPPWVAFAGRSAQPLTAQRRQRWRQQFLAFRGYPSLHGLFVELSARLAPEGVLALLLPSSVADLAGYGPTRSALTRSHLPLQPLVEFGQDAFAEVTQPCFALVAVPAVCRQETPAPWTLAERTSAAGSICTPSPPDGLLPWMHAPPLPAQCFRELGFQSNRVVTESMLKRCSLDQSPEPAGRWIALLEGRDVRAFRQQPPSLFLDASESSLRAAGVRLHSASSYAAVDFVVRQTAKLPIAAAHQGFAFRNSLLAGYAHQDLDRDLLVGLLNSALFRGLHLVSHRDARQAAFPQVKVAHLRGLPHPPEGPAQRERVRLLCSAAAAEGQTASLQHALDVAVFELYGVPQAEWGPIWKLVTEAAGRHHPLPANR